MLDLSISNSILCPACKGKNFSITTEGFIQKKNIFTCNDCGTVLEQSGKGEKSRLFVKQVGEKYSNADRLLKYQTFTIPGLSSNKLSIASDEQLEEYAKGNFEGLTISMEGELDRDIILKKEENIKFWLGPIDYLEERRKKGSGSMGSFGFRVMKGVWYRTPQLFSGQSNELTKLDSGVLIFTNLRYLFMGQVKSIVQPLSAITAINPYTDGVGLIRSGKQKTEFFAGNYHWPLISSIIIGLVKNAID